LISQVNTEYLIAKMDNNVSDTILHLNRLKAFKRAVQILKNLDFRITSADDVANLPGIGKGSLKRITEILETGTLAELRTKYLDDRQKQIDQIEELMQVIGIGNAFAKKLIIDYKITSVDELKDAVQSGKIKINYMIQMGLKYYGIVQGKIPRKETASIEKYLIGVAHQIDPKIGIIICGSYRRGKDFSGDIDVLFYHPDIVTKDQIINYRAYNLPSYLQLFESILSKKGFLLDNMVNTKTELVYKYMGFCKYQKYPVRRIDIMYTPTSSLETAKLYFTGPFELNSYMRSAAKKRQLILNEHGLYKVIDVNGIIEKVPIEIKSEKQVFDILGMEYLTPVERENFSA
jgi:DNA polymerase beta